jgi:SAM-dependent methyltransferase
VGQGRAGADHDRWTWRWAAAAVVGAGGAGLWWWWRLHPTSRPFAQRLWVDTPHPFVTQGRLREALRPVPGERLLEVGVGSGRYALPVAAGLGGDGLMAVVDLHDDMLTLTMRRAGRRGLRNVVPIQADAAALPFAADAFDAGYLVSTLGQVGDPTAALTELRRVVRPGGRVVVGELGYDPHGVSFRELRARASSAGLALPRRAGRWGGYVACSVVPG